MSAASYCSVANVAKPGARAGLRRGTTADRCQSLSKIRAPPSEIGSPAADLSLDLGVSFADDLRIIFQSENPPGCRADSGGEERRIR